MKLFKRFSLRTKIAFTAVITMVAVVIPVGVVMASSGPSRPTKVYYNGVPGFNYVTFDSFTHVPKIGDERNFFNGMYPNGTALTDPLAQVKNGDVLTLEVYVHNDADPSLNTAPGQPGIAHNTKVRVNLPNNIATAHQATAYISASNARPQQIYDTLNFSAANHGAFQLIPVPNSVQVRSNFIDMKGLSTSALLGSGLTIGTDALNGNVKACFKQQVLVTFKVKVKMPEYSIAKQVRFKGQTSKDWKSSVTANPGQDLQWLVTFKNNGSTPLNSVNVVDKVPAGLNVVPGSVKLINGNYPSGYVYPSNAVQDNGRTINVNIGNYNPGILAYVMYDTVVAQPTSTTCGTETLMNKAYATPQGFGAIWNTASAVVDTNKPCVQPKTIPPVCNLLGITQGDNRTVKVSNFQYTANSAVFKNVVINWGDSSQALTADNTTVVGQTHQYNSDGTYTITATANFVMNGQNVAETSDSCAKTVTFTTVSTPPTKLVNTGPGDVSAIFAATSAGSVAAYQVVARRRRK